ncbi:MAG TPA: hypothetical protein VJU16_04465 [Planctomycetota bacterium]|nr:hypothetical protein [Planctomycetota bacterium]
MSTLIRCPRCKSETDASASKPGSIIKCVHCRGDMRVPDAPKTPASGAGGRAGGGRQSTLFRRMTNATVPGQRGRSVGPSGGSGNERGASGQGRDNNALYMGAGIAALVAVIIAIGLVMKGKGSAEPTTGKGGAKKEMRAPVAPPPPSLPPPPPPPPPKVPERVALDWEPDAMNFVLASVKPLNTDATAEKDGLHFIRSNQGKRIIGSPFRYMPFVINSLVSEDRDLARAAFQVLYDFCEERSIRTDENKNPINISKVNNAEYRGYIYQMMTEWWARSASKLPDSPGNAAAVEKTDWMGLARAMIGGSFHIEDSPAGIAYRKVKNLGRTAWPKMADLIDHDELPLGRAVAQALQELTGEKTIPLPNERNRSDVKAAWQAWIEKNK